MADFRFPVGTECSRDIVFAGWCQTPAEKKMNRRVSSQSVGGKEQNFVVVVVALRGKGSVVCPVFGGDQALP